MRRECVLILSKAMAETVRHSALCGWRHDDLRGRALNELLASQESRAASPDGPCVESKRRAGLAGHAVAVCALHASPLRSFKTLRRRRVELPFGCTAANVDPWVRDRHDVEHRGRGGVAPD